MNIKKKDFIELEFTGKIKETEEVFDTTDEKIAKESGLFSEKMGYGPVIICVGEGMILPGLEEQLIGKTEGKYEIHLDPEHSFGKKTAQLIQLIPTKKFLQQQIRPVPGLQVNIDGALGIIKTVTGGRTLVDFNHPLSGKDVVYEVSIKCKVDDKKEQAQAILSRIFKLKKLDMELKEKELYIALPEELPKEAQQAISDKITELTDLKKVNFVKELPKKEPEKNPEKGSQTP